MSRPAIGATAMLVAAISLASASEGIAKGPTLSRLVPAGGQRGQTVLVEAAGSFDHWPPKSWTDAPGLVIEPAAEKGKLSIRIDPEAEPGVRWIRLYDEEGATGLVPFVIGLLPESAETEPNNEPAQAQAFALPSVINGRLGKSGDVDGFSVSLDEGQTLVADVEAARDLGSPMDAVLQVATPAGIVLLQNDDAAGRDPRAVFRAPSSGTYLVRVFAFPATPDSGIRFAGGEAFVYRLTMTVGGFLEQTFPLAVSRDAPSSVLAIGPNIPEEARSLAVPTVGHEFEIETVFHPLLAGTARVRRVEGPAIEEVEPNDQEHPHEVPGLVAVSGRIDPPGDRDTYRLVLRKEDRRTIRVEARSLGLASTLDPVIRVLDPNGKPLAEKDDEGSGRDAGLEFVAPEDGAYSVVVLDLNDRGGPPCVYLLRVLPDEPDFTLSLAADRFESTPDKPAEVVVTIDRTQGFSDPIEITIEGPPDGVSASPVVSQKGQPTEKTVTLPIKAEAVASSGPFRIVGRSSDGQNVRSARAAIPEFGTTTDRPWLTTRAPSAPPQ